MIYYKYYSKKGASTMNNLKHGLAKTRIYSVWSTLKQSRNKKIDIEGITRGVVDEWVDDFLNFYRWAIEHGYEDSKFLHRYNIGEKFGPNNCFFDNTPQKVIPAPEVQIKTKKEESLYYRWKKFKNHCTNPCSDKYYLYGGRGVSFYSEWENSFDEFKKWAFSNGFEIGYSLERKNLKGDFDANNCFWNPEPISQHKARLKNLITINGETKTINQWSEETGLSIDCIKRRIKNNIHGEKLIEKEKKIDINGVSKTFEEWSQHSGVKIGTLRFRYYQQGIKGKQLLAPPQKIRDKKHEINGVSRTLKEWEKVTGINRNTMYARTSKGSTGEDIIRPIGKRSKKIQS